MIKEIFTLKLISVRDCFLHFSFPVLQKLSSRKSPVIVLNKTENNEELYFSYSPDTYGGLNENCVGISAVYASNLGLSDNEAVMLSTCGLVPVVKTVYVKAKSDEDYEVMEMSQKELQSSMLDQVCVVAVGQTITVWFSKSLHCSVCVYSLGSLSVGRLEQFTVVIIAPDDKPMSRVKEELCNHDVNNTNSSCWEYSSKFDNEKISTDDRNRCISNLNSIIRKEVLSGIFRVMIVDDDESSCCNSHHNGIKNPYNAFIDKHVLSVWANKSIDNESAVICLITPLPKKFSKKSYENELYIRLYPIINGCQWIPSCGSNSNLRNQPLYVSNTVKRILKLKAGSKVRSKIFKPRLDVKITSVLLVITDNLIEKEVETWFREELPKSGNILINNKSPLPILSDTGVINSVYVFLWPNDIPCWPFSSAELKTCDISITYMKDIEKSSDNEESDNDKKNEGDKNNDIFCYHQNSLNSIPFSSIANLSKNLSDVVKEGLASLELCLGASSSNVLSEMMPIKINNNVLCAGSGAYILAEWLCESLTGPPHSVHVEKIDCKSLKGKKVENIQKRLITALQDCIYFQPSLLVLFDLDSIAGKPNQPEFKTEENFLLVMGRLIRETILENQLNQNIGILATARSTDSVSVEILGPRCYHLFPVVLHFPSLTKEDRIHIIREVVCKRIKGNNFENINLEEFASRTDNYSFEDLLLIADKSVFQAWQRKAKGGGAEKVCVTLEDLLCALDSYTPSHLHSINLYKSTEHSWNSVGGMKKLKESLTEVIIWPSKFQKVYEQCPLRSESGVLLYGVPGSGKTLLAKALAGEAGLNFISVKGPELLSKYIGASEEAVRKVFEKANKAKPCILFFDEFDSLAPRRGNDSSGVMDRVVNQLLTQMDGVEECSGVFIVAATSRPDLLDPALLRPGRIGHILFCPLPETEDRLEIMEVLSQRLTLDKDCNLSYIADETKGFSGADLQALIYGAQMMAYDELNEENSSADKKESDDFTVQRNSDVSKKLVVKNSHLISALTDTKPSLKPEELKRFQNIYYKFQKLRSKTYQVEDSLEQMTQKVTLG